MDKKRILIVDDQPDNLHILVEILKQDFAVIAATNGEKALKLAHVSPQPVLVLQDVMMPDMDGFEVCEALKADPATKDIPLVFVTATNNESDYEKGISLGAVDFIQKPVSPALLKNKINQILTHMS